MYHYRLSAGNPESTDWILDFDHEKEFTEEEFNEIAEAALLYALETEYKKEGITFWTSINTDHVLEFLAEKGFVPPTPMTCSYDFEPCWGRDSIKSEKLLAWVTKPTKMSAPQYMIDEVGDLTPKID